MPPLEGGGHLLDALFEIGPVMGGGMGPAPLSHAEIESWIRLTGTPLQPWEARCIRRLSVDYVNQSQASTARDCKPPWQAPDQKPVVSDTQAALRALANL